MESYTLSELGLFIAGIFGGISGLIFALQKSRCSEISCCGASCKRKLKPDEPNEIIPPIPNP